MQQASSNYARWLVPVLDDDLALQKKQEQRNWKSQGLAWIKTGPLDPFLRLPADLDMKDRNMLFYCKRPHPHRECLVIASINRPRHNASPRPRREEKPRLLPRS